MAEEQKKENKSELTNIQEPKSGEDGPRMYHKLNKAKSKAILKEYEETYLKKGNEPPLQLSITKIKERLHVLGKDDNSSSST